ncbi:MAG: ATPase [Erythrobacter sp.]
MTGGTHIRAVGQDAAQNAQDTANSVEDIEPLALEDEWVQEPDENEEDFLAAPADRSWILPTAAMAAIAVWTALFAWSNFQTITAGAAMQQWVSWISAWSLPVLLICTLWLLGMRNSKREAARFSDTASQLGRETADLEAKLGTINRELSLAREFLGTQTRELEYFGRSATENLSTNAEALQDLIKTNGDKVQAIASVSDTALSNMEKLRDDLPVVTNAARDASNQIGNAGKTADEQLQGLVSGFERLNDFGQASGRQVGAISAKIEKALEGFETQVGKLDKVSEARFEGLKAKSKAYRNELNNREVDALAAMRRRAEEVKAQADELMTAFAAEEEKTLGLLKTRMSAIKGESDQIGDQLVQSHEAGLATIRQSKERVFTELSELAGNLFAMDEKAAQSAKTRMEGLFKEATRFDEILAARDNAFEEKMAARQTLFDTRENEASEALNDRLKTLDDAITERSKEHIAHAEDIAKQGEAIANKMFDFNRLIEGASQLSESTKERFAASLTDLTSQIAENEAKLGATKASLSELTEDGIRLLEIIQSGTQQSRDELPLAIEQASGKLSEVEQRASELNALMLSSSNLGDKLSQYALSSADNVAKVDGVIEAANAKFVQHNDNNLAQLRSLQGAVEELGASSEALTEKTQGQLNSAIEQLERATHSAFSALEANLESSLENSTGNFSEKAVKALEKSIQGHSEEAITRLEEAANQAAMTGRETAVQLRDQLSKVDDLAGNLEQRVTRARAQAEEKVDNDFARRMALITESLNSHAIDISKSLSNDVTDTAWAAYLKGDRGIFTRRAVKLVDNAEARELSDLYESDDVFREHVSRFIHDFEGMLRSVLSTRDGNALGVTVLGSDMGKLYVALAQAIDRLRN